MKADDTVMTALHAIEQWAEEDIENHVALVALYDKSGKDEDTFSPLAKGMMGDIATVLAYMAYRSPGFEDILKRVVKELPGFKAYMDKRKKE